MVVVVTMAEHAVIVEQWVEVMVVRVDVGKTSDVMTYTVHPAASSWEESLHFSTVQPLPEHMPL
jgi:hypothetical protein